MLAVEWKPITGGEILPPFGDELQKHISRYKGSVRQVSCSAWELLYRMLTDYGFPISQLAFTPIGKPYFTDASIYFSLSHSMDLCAAAIADSPVGVDIEIYRPAYNPRLVKRCLSETEKQFFDGDFTRLWSRKEAVAKMTGEGLTVSPSYIETGAYHFQEQWIEYQDSKYWLAAVQQDHKGSLTASHFTRFS